MAIYGHSRSSRYLARAKARAEYRFAGKGRKRLSKIYIAKLLTKPSSFAMFSQESQCLIGF